LAAAGGALATASTGRLARAQSATPVAAGDRVTVQGIALGALPNGAFISPLVEIYGQFEIGARSFVAGNTVFDAGDGVAISLGDENNCQDNAYLIARGASLHCGNQVSIAHQAALHNVVVGDFAFFGFRARVRNAKIGSGSMVMHNTLVDGVVIPPNRITPLGARITTQAQADALPEITHANEEFKSEVQEVNVAFARGYADLLAALGRDGLEGVGPNPVTPFTPQSVQPQLGDGVRLGELVRIVGDVRLGAGSVVGQRGSIRADEGTPIVVGRQARIGSRVTFHALKGTRVDVGDFVAIGEEAVIHGPVRIGDAVTIGAGSVVFQATVEDGVEIRPGATVAGQCTLRQGTVVPEGAVVATQADADALPTR
jgi:carbonic anhydrase/acetyltransferase-like protein (isoleucine patch superfamily)